MTVFIVAGIAALLVLWGIFIHNRLISVVTLIIALGLPAAAFAAEKMPPGFIAVSATPMSWADAKAWCRQQGGKLPLINGSERFAADNSGNLTIDGFGTLGSRWPTGLPKEDFYWTGTVLNDIPDNSLTVGADEDQVTAYDANQSATLRAVCVASPVSQVPAGFIAMPESPMNWTDAKAFCKEKGGRLPLLGGAESRAGSDWPPSKTPIDGFGTLGSAWPAGLPNVNHWTGTVDSGHPDRAWDVYNFDGTVDANNDLQNASRRVVCVQQEAARKAEETRKVEEAQRAREAEEVNRLKKRFIAVSESPMNWAAAKDFCKKKNGKLPVIGGSESRAVGNGDHHIGIPVGGFGITDGPWPAGVPSGDYWTGTADSDRPSAEAWYVFDNDGRIVVFNSHQSDDYRVACVP